MSFEREKLIKTFKILLAFGVVGVIVVFFVFMERKIWSRVERIGPLVLLDKPAWVSEALTKRVYEHVGAREFPLQQNAIIGIHKQLSTFPWLIDPQLLIAQDRIQLRARWRKPIARVHSGTTRFYVDANGVGLDNVALDQMPLVTIRGVRLTRMPGPGQSQEMEDLQAAVALVKLLDYMDHRLVPGKPLLRELDRIDVSNFREREQRGQPQIIFYAKDGTPIHWGAEVGAWAQFVEVSDEDKLAILYKYYQERGTLQGGVKLINLRDPRYEVPQPAQQVQPPTY